LGAESIIKDAYTWSSSKNTLQVWDLSNGA